MNTTCFKELVRVQTWNLKLLGEIKERKREKYKLWLNVKTTIYKEIEREEGHKRIIK